MRKATFYQVENKGGGSLRDRFHTIIIEVFDSNGNIQFRTTKLLPLDVVVVQNAPNLRVKLSWTPGVADWNAVPVPNDNFYHVVITLATAAGAYNSGEFVFGIV